MDILVFSILTNLLYYCTGKILSANKNQDFFSLFYVYFLGSICVSSIALFLNFFIKLDQLVNSLFYLIILLIFLIKEKFQLNKNNIKFLIISSIITFLLLLYSNINRPDAGLYHLPFISLLNENKIIFGISNIHFRFGHTSILQYLSAINNNYLFGENGVSIPVASIVSFFYLYFLYDIWNVIKYKEKISVSNIFSLFILIYISYKIIRYSAFGNDAVAHLTYFYLISYILKNNLENIKINKTLLITTFIFINKTTLSLAFIIPLSIIFLKKIYQFEKIQKIFFSPASILIFLWLIKNILISGCAIYPMKITCFNSFDWTNEVEIKNVYNESQAWSKGWPDRENKNISLENFNKNFNWLETWEKKHLKYILKIIVPYFLFILIISLVIINKNIFSKKNINKDLNLRLNLCIFTSLIGFISFFLIFPIYRYGYSFIVTLISLFCIQLIKDKISNNILIFKVIFSIAILIFLSKQIQKINKNYENGRWPNIYTLNDNGQINKTIKKNIGENFYYYKVISGDHLCMYSKSPCTSYELTSNIDHTLIYNYSIITNK